MTAHADRQRPCRDPLSKGWAWHKAALCAAACTLPFAALQVLCAWWSAWLEATVDSDNEIGEMSFASFSPVPCPGGPQGPKAVIRQSECDSAPLPHAQVL